MRQAVDAAMEDFRNFKKSKKFKELVIDVTSYEEEADQLLDKHLELAGHHFKPRNYEYPECKRKQKQRRRNGQRGNKGGVYVLDP